MNEQYAEDYPYWKTSRNSQRALDTAEEEINRAGGRVLGMRTIATEDGGTFTMAFLMDGEQFRFIEPILPSRNGDKRNASIQAAVSLKHSIKARCVEARRKGARAAFFGYLVMPNNQTLVEYTDDELVDALPDLQPLMLENKQ